MGFTNGPLYSETVSKTILSLQYHTQYTQNRLHRASQGNYTGDD